MRSKDRNYLILAIVIIAAGVITGVSVFIANNSKETTSNNKTSSTSPSPSKSPSPKPTATADVVYEANGNYAADLIFRIRSTPVGKCLQMRNKTMALEDCVDDDEQRYRHLKYRENESIMRAQNMKYWNCFDRGDYFTTDRTRLAVDDCNGESIYYLSPDSKLKATSFRTCISSEDISIIECENSTAFGWIYEYLPSTTVSSKERLFRLKAGNGQCLHQVQRNRFQMRTCTYEGEQIFRRALIDDPTKGFQNIKFFQCLSSAAPDDIGRIGLGGGSCNRLETTFLSGGKLVNSRLNERLCLSWDLLYKPCDNSSDQEGWELETFIPPTPLTPGTGIWSSVISVTTTSTPTATATPLGNFDRTFRLQSSDGRCLEQRGSANPELKPCGNQESQQFRRARGFGQSNSDQDIYKAWAMQSVESYHCLHVKGSVDPNELRTLSSTDTCSSGTARLSQDRILAVHENNACLSSIDLSFRPCNTTNPSDLTWRTDLIRPENASTKSRYFRLKSGTNQCLQQQSVTQYQLQPCSDVDIQKFRLDDRRSFHLHLQNAVSLASLNMISDDFGRMGVVPEERPYRPVYLEGELLKAVTRSDQRIVCLSSTLVFEDCPQTVNATFSWVMDTL